MRSINTVIPGQTLSESLQLNGVCEGILTVPDGIYLQLNGVVQGDLLVEGGQAEVNGVVTGDIRNNGGRLNVRGVVQGAVFDEGAANTMIETGAIVNGRRH